MSTDSSNVPHNNIKYNNEMHVYLFSIILSDFECVAHMGHSVNGMKYDNSLILCIDRLSQTCNIQNFIKYGQSSYKICC